MQCNQYVKPINLKFKISPKIPILHVVNNTLEALAKSYKNTILMWTDFQNSLTWLTGMKKLIFYSNNFFGSGQFFDPWNLKNRSENGWSQKSCYNEKSVFSHPSTARRNFVNLSLLVLYFLQFLARASNGHHYSKR